MLKQEVIAPEDGRGHDDVGVNGPVRKLQPASENLAPAFGFAAGVFVANQHGCVHILEKLFEGVVWVAAKNEANAALFSVFFHIAQALLHEVIVAEVGVGVVGNHREEDNDWQAKQVCGIDRNVERGILMDAHGALHPVDNALGVGLERAVATDQNARVVGEFRERFEIVDVLCHWHRPGCRSSILDDSKARARVRRVSRTNWCETLIS